VSQLVNIIVDGLHSKFNSSHTELEHALDLIGPAPVGSRLNTHAYTAMLGGFIQLLCRLKVDGFHAVERVETQLNERILVVDRIRQKGAPHDYEFDLLNWMSHIREGAQPHGNLPCRVEVTPDRAQNGGGLYGVALGRTLRGGAIDAVARAGKRLGHDGNRRNAGDGSRCLPHARLESSRHSV